MKYLLLNTLLMFFSSSIISLKAQTELKIYQDIATHNNLNIQSLYKHYEMLKQKTLQIARFSEPQVGIGYFINTIETRVGPQLATFSLAQPLPWLGKVNALEQASIERAKVALEHFYNEQSKNNFNVAISYFNLYVAQSAIKITERNITLVKTLNNLAEVKFKSGIASMVDLLQTQMEMEELTNQLEYLKNNKQFLIIEFEKLLNTNLNNQEVNLPETLWTTTLNSTKEDIFYALKVDNPPILSIEHEILSYSQDILVAKKRRLPVLAVGLNYIVIGENENYIGEKNGKDAILSSMSIKVPLYKKRYRALIKEKKLAKESAKLKKEELINKLELKTAEGLRNYNDAIRNITLYSRLIKNARQALEILMVEYSSSKVDFEKVIQMNRKLLTYELELEKSRASQNIAIAYINHLIGQ